MGCNYWERSCVCPLLLQQLFISVSWYNFFLHLQQEAFFVVVTSLLGFISKSLCSLSCPLTFFFVSVLRRASVFLSLHNNTNGLFYDLFRPVLSLLFPLIKAKTWMGHLYRCSCFPVLTLSHFLFYVSFLHFCVLLCRVLWSSSSSSFLYYHVPLFPCSRKTTQMGFFLCSLSSSFVSLFLVIITATRKTFLYRCFSLSVFLSFIRWPG